MCVKIDVKISITKQTIIINTRKSSEYVSVHVITGQEDKHHFCFSFMDHSLYNYLAAFEIFNAKLSRKSKMNKSDMCNCASRFIFSCISDWRFHEFYPCRNFHLAWGVPDESRAVQWQP
jgi:hypothetical protein